MQRVAPLRRRTEGNILSRFPGSGQDIPLEQTFTRSEVERITGTSRRQLEHWVRLGLLRPRARWGERFFTFADLVAIETLNRLEARRIPAGRLRRAIDALGAQLDRARAPLSLLRISTNGTRIVVWEPGPGGRPIEPLSGQFVLNFDTGALERKVCALGERTAEEWFEMGMAWDAAPETLADAADAYRRAVAASPQWVEAQINLGTTLYRMGKLRESEEAFLRALEIDPESALAHFNLGCVRDVLGQTAAAIAAFRAALERAPAMADAHLNLALAYEKTGRKADAIRHLSLYLSYEPQGPWSDYARQRVNRKRRSRRTGKITPFRRVHR